MMIDALYFKKIAFDQNFQNSKNTIATFLYWLHVKTYTCETARVVPLVSTPTCQYIPSTIKILFSPFPPMSRLPILCPQLWIFCAGTNKIGRAHV